MVRGAGCGLAPSRQHGAATPTSGPSACPNLFYAGKSTLTDSLVAAAGIMAVEQVGHLAVRNLQLAGP
jgi:hypothetical protein